MPGYFQVVRNAARPSLQDPTPVPDERHGTVQPGHLFDVENGRRMTVEEIVARPDLGIGLSVRMNWIDGYFPIMSLTWVEV